MVGPVGSSTLRWGQLVLTLNSKVPSDYYLLRMECVAEVVKECNVTHSNPALILGCVHGGGGGGEGAVRVGE